MTPRSVAAPRSRCALAAVLAVGIGATVPETDAVAQSLTTSSRVSTSGLGPVLVGMTVRQAERAGGVDLASDGQQRNGCRYVRPRDRRIAASLMVIRGRIARVDVSTRGVRTSSGFRVGDAERSVRRAFAGRLRVMRHEYIRGWYLEFVPRDASDRNRRVVFETDGRRVTYIRAGRLPEARYIEGCS